MLGLLMACGLEAANAQGGDGALRKIELTCVDADATGYGTFQSHNQKVVSNASGIFMTHLRSRNDAYTAQQWRLSRSQDGGETFETVWEETNATNPATLETDEAGNIYLIRPDFGDHNAYLYLFLAENDYSDPTIHTIPGGSAGKFAAMYDPGRKQLYWLAHHGQLSTLTLNGEVTRATHLLKAGSNAGVMYPFLYLEPSGVLHAAWTTQQHGLYMYRSIHHMLSDDGGETWRTMDGTPLAPPVVADDSGPSTMVSLRDEFDAHTFLSGFLCKRGKAHFAYMAQLQARREHYIRYDVATGKREIDTGAEFKGEEISLMGLDGFFATDSDDPDSPLYFVGLWGDRLGCLESRDNGDTWHDYGASGPAGNIYAIGGAREITEDGYVIGSFTDSPAGGVGEGRVHFLRIKVRE
ncbi:MAG TPA: hypothetical protein QGH10_09320 [Armatimonadota bacterium]|nr:hypothetical protein [Armatimonadota bacterium]